MQHEVEDALRVADADGLADGMHGHADGDRLVGGDFLQVDVEQPLRDRIELHGPDDRHPGAAAVAVELEREELGRAFVAGDHLEHGPRVHGDRLGLAAAVEDGRHRALAAQPLGELLAGAFPALDGQLLHLHVRSPLARRTGSRRIPRRGSAGWPLPATAPP